MIHKIIECRYSKNLEASLSIVNTDNCTAKNDSLIRVSWAPTLCQLRLPDVSPVTEVENGQEQLLGEVCQSRTQQSPQYIFILTYSWSVTF